MTGRDAREYVRRMLRRDFHREPTEHEVEVWSTFLALNGAFAPDQSEEDEAKLRDSVRCPERSRA